MADAIRVMVPATSANLGPGVGVFAVALDLWNDIVITPRPGPLEVTISGEGADRLPSDETNRVCSALAQGLGVDRLTDMAIECTNRIPVGRGLGSSTASIAAGLVAANALKVLRWSPDDLLTHTVEHGGHPARAAACVWGGIVAVAPGPRALSLPVPDDLLFVACVPDASAEAAKPPDVATESDPSATIGNAVALAVSLERGDLDDLPQMLVDRLDADSRASVPGMDALAKLVGSSGCRGMTLSGSGPTVLLWCDRAGSAEIAASAEQALRAEGVDATVSTLRVAPGGMRCRWIDAADTRLAKAVG